MTTKVEKTIMVDVPVRTAYSQWTRFEDFPKFMAGVEAVNQLCPDRLQWVAEIDGVRRQWLARIVAQVPDQLVAWESLEGATNDGEVRLLGKADGETEVVLTLAYEPRVFIGDVGDRQQLVERQAENYLGRFKEYVESHGAGPESGDRVLSQQGTAGPARMP